MERASNLEMNANYHLFKTGVKPLWEDDANKEGGKWIIKLSARDRNHIDTYWQNLVLGLIGEAFDNADDVCGAVLSRRKGGDRISIWNKNRNDNAAIASLGKQIKQVVADGNQIAEKELQMQYSWHEDSIKTGAGFSNIARYTL
jgi:translation initiation factor 4E